MTKILRFGKLLAAFFALGLLWTSESFAQTGNLEGSQIQATNGSNIVTIKPAATTTSYTLTLPTGLGGTGLYVMNDGTGNLFLSPASTTSSTTTTLYNTSTAQIISGVAGTVKELFNVGYAAGGTGDAVGALIKVVGNGGSNTTFSGLTITAANMFTGALGNAEIVTYPNEMALGDTVANSGSGTQIGLQVDVSGSGNNYAAITTEGRVGIGTANPSDSVDVFGNIRISGVNGLKINEGSNGTMGTATLNGVNVVTINTNSVTASSRIFLTTFGNPNSAPIGAPYVSGRVVGASFDIKSTVALDVNKVAWIIIEP